MKYINSAVLEVYSVDFLHGGEVVRIPASLDTSCLVLMVDEL